MYTKTVRASSARPLTCSPMLICTRVAAITWDSWEHSQISPGQSLHPLQPTCSVSPRHWGREPRGYPKSNIKSVGYLWHHHSRRTTQEILHKNPKWTSPYPQQGPHSQANHFSVHRSISRPTVPVMPIGQTTPQPRTNYAATPIIKANYNTQLACTGPSVVVQLLCLYATGAWWGGVGTLNSWTLLNYYIMLIIIIVDHVLATRGVYDILILILHLATMQTLWFTLISQGCSYYC